MPKIDYTEARRERAAQYELERRKEAIRAARNSLQAMTDAQLATHIVKHHGDVSKSARVLGCDVRQLHHELQRRDAFEQWPPLDPRLDWPREELSWHNFCDALRGMRRQDKIRAKRRYVRKPSFVRD